MAELTQLADHPLLDHRLSRHHKIPCGASPLLMSCKNLETLPQ